MANYPPMPNALGQPPHQPGGPMGATGGFGLGGPIVPGQGRTPGPGQAIPMGAPTGAPVTLQPGQMPMQGENYQYQGFQQPSQTGMGGAPNTQFPLNPGMGGPIHGQQQWGGQPDGQFGGHDGYGDQGQWGGQNALGGGILQQPFYQLLQTIQTRNPDLFGRLMQSGFAQRFGITPQSIAAMGQQGPQQGGQAFGGQPQWGQPDQYRRHQWGPPVAMPGGGTTGAPLQPSPLPPVQGGMITAPVVSQTPVAPPAGSYQLPTY